MISAQVEETKGCISSTATVISDQNPEKKPYGYNQIKQVEEETKDFKSLTKLEKTIGTFGDDTKDIKEDDTLVDDITAKQIKEIADSEDLQDL